METTPVPDEDEGRYLPRRLAVPLLVFVVLFYFTYAGIELCFRSFIAVFCVNSSLALSPSQAADILAIFYTTFAAAGSWILPNCILFIVISAKSTNFTTNTRYHVESSVDEPPWLQQQVLMS